MVEGRGTNAATTSQLSTLLLWHRKRPQKMVEQTREATFGPEQTQPPLCCLWMRAMNESLPHYYRRIANRHNWREQRLFHNFRGFPSITDPKTWKSGSIHGSKMWETVHITADQEAERVAETFKDSPHNDSLQLHLPKYHYLFEDTNSKHAPMRGHFRFKL